MHDPGQARASGPGQRKARCAVATDLGEGERRAFPIDAGSVYRQRFRCRAPELVNDIAVTVCLFVVFPVSGAWSCCPDLRVG